MTRSFALTILAFASGILVAAPVPKDRKPAPPTPEELAAETARKFVKAVDAGDTKEKLRLMDVPFVNGGLVVATDYPELEKAVLSGGTADIGDYRPVLEGADAVLTVPKFLEIVRERRRIRLTADEEANLTTAAGPNGRVVLQVPTKQDIQRRRIPAFFVRIEDGVAKVVGSLE